MGLRRIVACLWLTSTLAACGQDAGAAVDAGATDAGTSRGDAGAFADAGFAIAPPAPPEIPWWDPDTGAVTLAIAPPAIAPCPAGWTEVPDADGIVMCEPWALGAGGGCGPFEVRAPGDTVCRHIGAACPAGEFPDHLPTAQPILYVRSGSRGRGTITDPFGTVGEALAAATDGTVVAIAAGTYSEDDLMVPAGVTLRGACVDQVVIQSATARATAATIIAGSPRVELRDLRVSGPRIGIISGRGSTRLQGVLIENVLGIGLAVSSATSVVADDLVIRHVRFGGGAVVAAGMQALGGGTFEGQRVVIDDVDNVGVLVGRSSTVMLSQSLVRGVVGPLPDGTYGIGIELLHGVATMDEVVVEDVRIQGIDALGPEAIATISRSLVRDVHAAVGLASTGLSARASGHLTADRSAVAHVEGYGVYTEPGASIVVRDAVVRDLLAFADGTGGLGIYADGTMATLARISMRDVQEGGLAADHGAIVDVEDLRIAHQTGVASGAHVGGAVAAENGGTMTARRLWLEGAQAVAVGVVGVGSTFMVEDLRVLGTRRQPVGMAHSSRGIAADDSGSLTVTRAVLDDCEDQGIAVGGGVLDAQDVVVRDMVDHGGAGQSGMAVLAWMGGELHLRRARLERAVSAAFVAVGTDVRVTVEDLSVDDVRTTSARPVTSGTGVGMQGGVTAQLDRVRVDGAGDAALVTGLGSTVTVNDFVVGPTRGDSMTGRFGDGIVHIGDGTLSVTAALIAGAHELGVCIRGTGAHATFERLAVVDTAPRVCAMTDCSDQGAGSGIGIFDGASVSVSDFAVSGSALCGVQLASSASLDLARGTVARNAVGACIQVSGYDVARLSSAVDYRDNGRNLDATTLPVPEPLSPVGTPTE